MRPLRRIALVVPPLLSSDLYHPLTVVSLASMLGATGSGRATARARSAAAGGDGRRAAIIAVPGLLAASPS